MVKSSLSRILRKATRLVTADPTSRFDLWRDWVARWDLREHECIRRARTPGRPVYSFLVAHKDCIEFLELCLRGILHHASGLDFEIIVADDDSVGVDLSMIASLDPRISVYRFRDGRGHPQALQWLWYRARGEYAVVMDQDAILLGSHWKPFEMDFEARPELLLIGVRDQCRLRGSPEMLHPSFIMAHKGRCDVRLGRPLFFGPKPNASKYRFAPQEEYYAFFCKALDQNPRSIRYLDQHQTKYGFGTIAYRDDHAQPVIYHQWYSGRVSRLGEDELIDNLFKVSELRESNRQFLRDHRAGVADLSAREWSA